MAPDLLYIESESVVLKALLELRIEKTSSDVFDNPSSSLDFRVSYFDFVRRYEAEKIKLPT